MELESNERFMKLKHANYFIIRATAEEKNSKGGFKIIESTVCLRLKFTCLPHGTVERPKLKQRSKVAHINYIINSLQTPIKGVNV